MLTPADVHYGRVEQRITERQAVLDAAYQAHPERFARRPLVARPPTEVWINKPVASATPAITSGSHIELAH